MKSEKGEMDQSCTVELGPEESRTVSFEVTPQQAKTYQVSVNGLTGSFVAMIVGLLFKLVKLTRAIRIFFGGYKGMEEKHKLFQMEKPLTSIEIYRRLIPHGYQYNTMSTTFKKQIFTVRKLTDVDHQIHLRFYSDAWVSGHYEHQPDMSPALHLKGVDLRSLTPEEREEIRSILNRYKREKGI